QSCMDIFSYFVILSQLIAVIFTSVPVGFPSSDDSQAISYWIGLLSHIVLLALSIVIRFHDHGYMVGTLSDPMCPPLGSRPKTFQHSCTAHPALLDIEFGVFQVRLLDRKSVV